jgi:predicted aspartyl protease
VIKIAKILLAGCLSVTQFGLVVPLSAHALDTKEQAMALFKKKSYPQAAALFGKSFALTKDADTLYYQALSLQYAKNFEGAKALYKQIYLNYNGTQAAQYALQALAGLDPKFYAGQSRTTVSAPQSPVAVRSSGSSSQTVYMRQSGRDTSRDTLPRECKVYFERHGSLLVVDTTVNGRPQKMIFDTGAEVIAMGKNHLEELGLRGPSGQASGKSAGVGDGGAQDTWHHAVDIKVGQIERKNFPVMVQESLGVMPLLGQTFFDDYSYTIDYGSKTIVFVKKQAGVGAMAADPKRDPNNVPFVREGKEMVVTAYINGRPQQFYFDTGAESVLLSPAHVRSIGLSIPEDARAGKVQGIAGSSNAVMFPVRRMTMGPIDKSDVMVTVSDGLSAGHGLLGQEFYQGWQYTIDYDHSLIMFKRR